jgi:hypothetical protein
LNDRCPSALVAFRFSMVIGVSLIGSPMLFWPLLATKSLFRG